jgi:nucleoside-diphosphate-sugar epimerase
MLQSDLAGAPVLVTGGAGFIGSHLVDALLARGARVRVLDDLSTGRLENLDHCLKRLQLLEDDIRDLDACRRACAGVTFVLHLAALGSVPRSMHDPAVSLAVNVTGTANLLAAARDCGVQRVVYASSSSVYGDSDRLPKREGEEGRPLSPYALSKVMNEELAEVFHRLFGLSSIGLRYFNVYGPRQRPDGPYAAVIPRFFAACARGEAPVILGDGEQSRDFTYVADAVAANLAALAAPPSSCGRAYNVARGERTTLNDLARAVLATAGRGREPVHSDPRDGDVRHSLASTSAARERLGFVAGTDLGTGLRAASQHYLETARRAACGPAI